MTSLRRGLALTLLLSGLTACSSDPIPTDVTDTTVTDMVSSVDSQSPDITPDIPSGPQACEEALPEIGAGVCALQQGTPDLLIRGNILLPHGIQEGGAVLISGGLISCVGCGCMDLPAALAATRLTCPQALISPGLINAHDHIGWSHAPPVSHGAERYDHRHEWRKGKNGKTKLSVGQGGGTDEKTWGEIRQIINGTTSFFASGGVSGYARNLDQKSNLGGLSHGTADYSTFPLGDSDGSMQTSGCGTYDYDNPESAAQETAYVPHIAEGVNKAAQNEFACVSGQEEGGVDYVLKNAAFIHGIGLTTADVGLMVADNASLVWSPRSNISLYGMTANVPLYDRLGALIALGSDWVPSGSMNLLRELVCADYFNSNFLHGYFSDADLVAMVTQNAAQALGFGDLLGSLVVGKVADVAIWDARTNEGYRAILDGHSSDVTLVLRGGEVLYGDSSLVGALAAAKECEIVDVCGVQKRLCTKAEGGSSLLDLKAELSNAYPLFFCDTPDNEPTCHPARQGEYNGAITPKDSDGDGLQDGDDNCPFVFNPLRPMDSNKQNDADGDGDGDECDPCPFDADTDACSSVDPEDVDGDGVQIPFDNCPAVANSDQADADTDGAGDACDPCPEFANPGGSACPGNIYAIKKGESPEGDFVAILDATVTAVTDKFLFIQADPQSDGYEGLAYSGIFVYYPAGADANVGDRVRVEGKVNNFYGQTQLSGSTVEVIMAGGGNVLPTDVSPEEVAEGGPLADKYEGLLVRVKSVEVLDTTPLGADGETVENEFLVTGNLSVDDYIYLIEPSPQEGQILPEITGVMQHSWDRKKLLPRGPEDLDLGDPSLLALDGGTGQLYAGQTTGLLTAKLSHASKSPHTLLMSSGAPGIAKVSNVTIPAGETEVLIDVTGVAEGMATLSASLGETSKSVSVSVLSADYQPSVVTLEPLTAVVTLGGSLILTVGIDAPAPPGGLVVGITSQGVPATHPESIVIEEGSTEGTFKVKQFVSTGFITVVASSGGSSKSATLDVQDALLYGMLLVEVLYDSKSGDDKKEWVKIYNGTGTEVDLSNYSIGYGGSDYTYGTYQLLGLLPADMCVLVGGPATDDTNGEPDIDMPKDFDPDLQNSGDTADGIALFDVPAEQVTEATVPLDAVVYGGENKSGLIGSDGAPVGSPHVADVSGGKSIVRISISEWGTDDDPDSSGCIQIK
jgi:large repetitive protein